MLLPLVMIAAVGNSVFHPADFAVISASVMPGRLGRAFALQACSVCHIVAPGQLTPPRISNAVSFRSIANTTGMNEMKLQAILSTPHAIMPNLILTPEEAADVITYVMSLRTP